jgi:hypothetical protein
MSAADVLSASSRELVVGLLVGLRHVLGLLLRQFVLFFGTSPTLVIETTQATLVFLDFVCPLTQLLFLVYHLALLHGRLMVTRASRSRSQRQSQLTAGLRPSWRVS